LVRIGELSRRTGVSATLLRAWESRYRLLQPERSSGGFRLYSEADEQRVRAMRAQLAAGLSAAQAAAAALRFEVDTADGSLRERLDAALELFDEAAAQRALDDAAATLSARAVVAELILPCLREVGDRFERGDATVGHEHFASNILRGRLLGLARGWAAGAGPRALLACPPGEPHDIGLIAFGLALREQGFRIVLLGADTPIESLVSTAEELRPEVVAVGAAWTVPFAAALPYLAAIAARHRLVVGGRGIPESGADGAQHLRGDPFAGAAEVAARA
jgi:DNA-binding transcriptional MerR regulator